MTRVVFFCCMLMCCVVAAEPSLPTKMTLSYVAHPIIENNVVPVLRETYSRLGIQVTFVEQPSARNLMLVSEGVTDGDVAFSDLLSSQYDNLITVGPDLLSSHFVLLCHQTLPCNEEVLFDRLQTVVMTDASRSGLSAWYGGRVTANLYIINHLDKIPELVQDGRFDYGVYPISRIGTSLDKFPGVTRFELFVTRTHHILHDKHAGIADQVGEVMNQVIKERGDILGVSNP